MTYEQLKTSVLELKKTYDKKLTPPSLRDKVRLTYAHWVLKNLLPIFKQHHAIDKLEDFLIQNWQMVKGTLLSPTASPNTDITLLLIEIAQFVADLTRKNPVQVLMPSVAVISLDDDYADLTQLEQVINTHCLSTNSLFLIPIKQLNTLGLSAINTRLYNVFYDYQTHPDESIFISSEEYTRLINHSTLTRALFDAQQNYLSLASDTSHLLGQLTELCRHLFLNGLHAHGSEEDAAFGAYLAIIQFNKYYNQLDNNKKTQIPLNLKEEIDRLLLLSTDHTINRQATSQMDTCVNSKRTALISKMNGHEALLSTISIHEQYKTLLIDTAKQQFEQAKQELKRAIEKTTYGNGFDNLSLTKRLLSQLDIKLRIHCPADLEIIKDLSASELLDICSEAELRRQIIQQLPTIDHLFIFIIEISPIKISAFLQCLSKEITQKLLLFPSRFTQLITGLDIEKCTLTCKALEEPLIGLIKSTEDLGLMLMGLEPEQAAIICTILREQMRSFIHSVSDFHCVIDYLGPNQTEILFEALKEYLPKLIKSPSDFNNLTRSLSLEQRAYLFDTKKIELIEMSHTTNDWELIVQWLTQAQINVLLCALFYTWLNDVYQNPWVRSAALIMTFTMIARIIQGVDAVLPTLILTTATVGAIGFFKYKPDENKALSLLSLALTPD